jgi:hypothetical protein
VADFTRSEEEVKSITRTQTALAISGLNSQLEKELRAALDHHWPQGWNLSDVKARGSLIRYGNIEVFRVDGEDLLELHPIEWANEVTENGLKTAITRKFRRLWK